MRNSRMSGRTLLGVAGLVLLTVLACKRSAEQNNFLGKACTGQGDCPSDLMCVAAACWEPCAPGGVCDEGFACQLGACVPGGAVGEGAGSSGGSGPTGPNGGTSEPGGADAGGQAGTIDGQLVLGSLPARTSSMTRGADDTYYVDTASTTDVFDQTTYALRATAYAGGAAKTVKTYLTGEQPPYECLVADGSIYYVPQTGGDAQLTRLRIADGVETPIAPARGGLRRSGTKILFVDSDENVRVYDASTSTLDPVIYGPTRSGFHVSLRGTQLTWLHGDGATYGFYQATLGGAGTAMPRSFPMSSSVTGMTASGTAALVLLGGSGSMLGMNIGDNSAPTTLGTGMIGRDVLEENGSLYLVEASSDLVRLEASGTKTKIGSFGSHGPTGLWMTATAIYAFVDDYGASGGSSGSSGSSGSGGGGMSGAIYKWTKPAP